LSLIADPTSITLSGGPMGTVVQARPVEFDDALLVGVVRMGVLHNIAKLSASQPPRYRIAPLRRPPGSRHAVCRTRDWVNLGQFANQSNALSFALNVAGEPAGTATLSLDARNLRAQREQRVVFPEGDARH
jgi:hypothetical protein